MYVEYTVTDKNYCIMEKKEKETDAGRRKDER